MGNHVELVHLKGHPHSQSWCLENQTLPPMHRVVTYHIRKTDVLTALNMALVSPKRKPTN